MAVCGDRERRGLRGESSFDGTEIRKGDTAAACAKNRRIRWGKQRTKWMKGDLGLTKSPFSSISTLSMHLQIMIALIKTTFLIVKI